MIDPSATGIKPRLKVCCIADIEEAELAINHGAKAVKELGGTGRTHDWTISRRIRDQVKIPVWLAGGLTPDNVGDAIRHVQPFGIDVCSGLRTNDRLDEDKLIGFVQNIEAEMLTQPS